MPGFGANLAGVRAMPREDRARGYEPQGEMEKAACVGWKVIYNVDKITVSAYHELVCGV